MEKDILVDVITKSKDKIFKNWKTAAFILVLSIFANLYYVKYSIVRNENNLAETSIFRTYKTTGNCFYQKKDSKKWLFLSGEEILSEGSELQTDADSHAILSFIGQSGRVEVSESTHLAISKSGKDTILDFKKGEMFINYQAGSVLKPLLLKIDKKIFKLTNADLYISGDVEEQVFVSVEYGKTTMALGSQVNSFEKGQSVLIRGERDYSVEDSKFKITTPFNYDRYNLEKDMHMVRFAFAPLGEEYQWQLMIGENPSQLSTVFPELQSKNEFSVPFKKGSYYWQLVAYQNKQPAFLSPLKRFFVEPQIPIQLVKPLLNSKFQLSQEGSIHFQWDNPSQLEKVFIEISTQKDFKKISVHESIPENNYLNYTFDQVGEYYWRVSGFPFGTSDLVTSSVGKISIVNEVVPQQVKILFPKEKIVLTTHSIKSSDITFQWTKNPATSVYSVEIKSLKNGKIQSHETSNTQIKIKDLEPGPYQWKVLDKGSNVVSLPEQFSVVQTRRLNFSNESEDAGFLSWQSGPRGTVEYRVEALRIGSRSDFNAFFNPKSETKKSLEIKGDRISYKNFSEGIYAFKVYALDTNKNILADSNLKFLKVRK